jgi:Protein of unknown function (DUF2934)
MSTTEKPKAAKAPAKPRKTAEKSATVKTAGAKTATAKAATKTAAVKTKAAAVPKPTPAPPTHQEIAMLAEKYWAERGWQDGAAEQDWLRAEQELMKLAS